MSWRRWRPARPRTPWRSGDGDRLTTQPSGADDDVALLTTLLTAEHAAVFGYGVLGARLESGPRNTAQAAVDNHRGRRDALAALLRDRSAPTPGPQAAYDVSVSGPTDGLQLAVRLEQGLSVRWRDLVAGTDDPQLRRLGVDGLVETAVRAASWRLLLGQRPPTVALPGTA